MEPPADWRKTRGDGSGSSCGGSGNSSGGATRVPDASGEGWAEDASGHGSGSASGSGGAAGKAQEDSSSQDNGSCNCNGADDALALGAASGDAASLAGSVPVDPSDDVQDNLPSLKKDGAVANAGSAGHPDECKPCAFYCYSLRGCRNGDDCSYCHQFHESRLKHRREAWKRGQRDKRLRRRERRDTDPPSVPAAATAATAAAQASHEEPLAPPARVPAATAAPSFLQYGGGEAALRLSPLTLPAEAFPAQSLRVPPGPCPLPRQPPPWPGVGAFPGLAPAPSEESRATPFEYTPASAVIRVGEVVELWPPVSLALMGLSFAVSPELPVGLVIDEHLGVIYGKAQAATDRFMPYFVAACEPDGSPADVRVAMVNVKVTSTQAVGATAPVMPGVRAGLGRTAPRLG